MLFHLISLLLSAVFDVLVAKLSPALLQPHRLYIACQAPLSMGFPRQEYWSRLQFALPGNLPDSGIEPEFPVLAGRLFTTEPPGDPYFIL